MDPSQYAELFLTESREHVSAINQWLLQLERDGAAAGAEPVSAIVPPTETSAGLALIASIVGQTLSVPFTRTLPVRAAS